MRWRFVDKIDAFEPWVSIRGRKSISLEEYSLLEPWGRKGELPEILVLESCVQLARWLVMKSSDFQIACSVSEVEQFSFEERVGPGEAMEILIATRGRGDAMVEAECEVMKGGQRIGAGKIRLSFLLCSELFDPQELNALWRELYDKA